MRRQKKKYDKVACDGFTSIRVERGAAIQFSPLEAAGKLKREDCKPEITGKCITCGVFWASSSADFDAAHHAKITGHHTKVKVIRNYHYNAPAGDKE